MADFSEIKGCETAKRALEIALVGPLSVHLRGPSGHGKSMLIAAAGGLWDIPASESTPSAESPVDDWPAWSEHVDLAVDVGPVSSADIILPPPTESSESIFERVRVARMRLATRFGCNLNEVPLHQISSKIWTDAPEQARRLMAQAVESLKLSPESFDRTCRVAACIAALRGDDPPGRIDFAEALGYRREGRK